MKISVITAVYNCCDTISDALESVLSQKDCDVEYIVVDGKSTDGTIDRIREYEDRIAKIIHEPDQGIYDALNKGIEAATGDVVGFLHADDLYADDMVLSHVCQTFADPDVQASYGDLVYVKQEDPDQVVRKWVSGDFSRKKFFYGWMPPHPTVYIRRECFEKFGGFDREMSISADYELLLRMMVRESIETRYIDRLMVRMRVGGKSNASFKNRMEANREDRLAWQKNDMRPPFGIRFLKPMRKIGQFFSK